MNAAPDDARSAFRETVRWLIACTGFPGRRLPAPAEKLVCLAALAAADEAADRQKFALQRRDPAQTSALRTHALRRSQVHFKCDNSAKV